MGKPMCLNLLQQGFTVRAFNRSPAALAIVAAAGALVADSPAAAATGSDIVITMLPDTPDVEQVVLGDCGILQGARSGMVLIDMSTISPARTRILAEQCRCRGVSMLDAPVSGGDIGAVEGTLSIMVGGDAAVLERCLPVLAAMGKQIIHVGPVGCGQMVKLVNQVIVVGNTLAMAEGLLLAARAGLDMDKCLAAVSGGAAGSWMLTHRGPQIAARDWQPGFMLRLQQKDLRLALQAAEETGTPLLAAKLAHSLYQALENRGLGDEGNHAMIKALEILAGSEPAAETSLPGPGRSAGRSSKKTDGKI